MKRAHLFSLLAVFGLLAGFAPPQNIDDHAPDNQKVILVNVEVDSPRDAAKAYSSQFDKERVEIDVPYDDPFFTLEDYSFAEDALEGPDCFMPQLKLIFREDTYVFSLYCTSVVRYRNQAPFKTSSKTARSDIKVTESVLDFLQSTHKKYFGGKFNPETAKKFHKVTKLEEDNIEIDDALLRDDDEQADKDLEKDALDKEGWFDETKDPGLTDDETPDVEEDDGE